MHALIITSQNVRSLSGMSRSTSLCVHREKPIPGLGKSSPHVIGVGFSARFLLQMDAIRDDDPSRVKNFIVTFPDGSSVKIRAHSISSDFSNGVIMLMDDALAVEAVLAIGQVRFVAEES